MGNVLSLLALVLFSANVFAVQFASARLAQDIGFFIALAANVFFGALLCVVDLLVRSTRFEVDPHAFGIFALAGIFASYLGRRGFFRSVETLGPSRASAIQITNPVVAAAVAWGWLGERLELTDVLLAALVLVGLFLTTFKTSDASEDAERGAVTGAAQPSLSRVPLTALWPAILATVAYGLGNVARAVALDEWREPIFGGFLGAVTGTVAYGLFHVPWRKATWLIRTADRVGLALWAGTGLLTISAQISVIAATGYIPVAVALVISSALPIVVVPVSIVVFRNTEQLGRATIAGTALVLVGVSGILLLG